MSENSNGSNGVGNFLVIVYLFVFGIMPIYAIYKDIQAGKMVWAMVDFVAFPLGGIRGLMYLFGG